MPERHTEVLTAYANRYLQQLCKHWSHRFEVRSSPSHGEIALPLGACALRAKSDRLAISLEADEASKLPQFQDIVEQHLRRFAFREELIFDWHGG